MSDAFFTGLMVGAAVGAVLMMFWNLFESFVDEDRTPLAKAQRLRQEESERRQAEYLSFGYSAQTALEMAEREMRTEADKKVKDVAEAMAG